MKCTLALLSAVLLFPACACALDVVLAWDPVSEPDLAGYRVYYGTSSRQYSAHITIGTQTTYTVTGLAAGPIYYFAVTAYSATDESGFSNEVSTAISTSPVPPSGGTITIIGGLFDEKIDDVWAYVFGSLHFGHGCGYPNRMERYASRSNLDHGQSL